MQIEKSRAGWNGSASSVIPKGVHHEDRAREDLEVTVVRERPGERSARFDEFFRLNFARTVRLAHLLSGSDAAAEDLAPESFARIHHRFDSIETRVGISTR